MVHTGIDLVLLARSRAVKVVLLACCLLAPWCSEALAQENEVSLSVGGGGFLSGGTSVGARAVTLAYTRNLTDHFAAEGGVELFWIRGDDFAGVQVAVLYHFRPFEKTRKVIPYVTAGIGGTSTDLTEIQGEMVIRLGGGLKYHFLEALGLRVEFRDEIVRTGESIYYPLRGSPQHFLSARAGIVLRF